MALGHQGNTSSTTIKCSWNYVGIVNKSVESWLNSLDKTFFVLNYGTLIIESNNKRFLFHIISIKRNLTTNINAVIAESNELESKELESKRHIEELYFYFTQIIIIDIRKVMSRSSGLCWIPWLFSVLWQLLPEHVPWQTMPIQTEKQEWAEWTNNHINKIVPICKQSCL